MIEIKNICTDYVGFKISATLSPQKANLSRLLEDVCSETNGSVEFIGKRIDKKREPFILVRYNDKLYYNYRWDSTGSDFTFNFETFSKELKDTEPVENYQYFIDYYNPKINGRNSFYWYFKEHELDKAKKMQKDLGGNSLALLSKL